MNISYIVVVVVITIFQNSQGNHVTVFTVVELYFMCTVDSLLLTIARTCMCIHFLFVFPILILWQSTVQLGDLVLSVCLICLLAMLLRLRYGSFHLHDVAIKHSKFAFLYSGLRPEKILNNHNDYDNHDDDKVIISVVIDVIANNIGNKRPDSACL